MASISGSSTTSSITVRVVDLDTSYAGIERVVTWSIKKGSTWETGGSVRLANGVSSGGAYTFSSLQSGTSYSIEAEIEYYSGTTAKYLTLSTSISTQAPPTPTFPKWDWTKSNGTASAALTQRAYNAVTGAGSVGDFSYMVWNDMVSCINTAVTASSKTWNSSVLTLASTKMTASDKTMTANRFNSLRLNLLQSGLKIPLATVSPGDTVRGSYFTTMMEYFNRWS